MGRLFGTDGVRGVANAELDCDLAFRLGQAAATVLTETTRHKPKILIGKDTRISSDMLEAALTAGVCSVGGDAVSLGVIPTPAVAYLVKEYAADAGFVVSASHNPFEHNGIKIFNGEGYKLSDEIEERVENLVLDGGITLKTGAEIGRSSVAIGASDEYVRHLCSVAGELSGMKLAFDCANGASSETLVKLVHTLGVKAHIINNDPDGLNINTNCGSTHPEELCRYVKENDCEAGFAFDGDADRMLAVDENGRLIDGDMILAIFANYMKEKGTLANDTLVCTTMSNLGLFEMCKNNGIGTLVTDVGDRYVLEGMLEKGHLLGGEASGHVILKSFATTGDGQAAAVFLMNIMRESGKTLSELADVMTRYPQVMVNAKVTPEVKKSFREDAAVKAAIAAAERQLGEAGRILVRASGTEPLVRVMVEGKNQEEITELANRVANQILALV